MYYETGLNIIDRIIYIGSILRILNDVNKWILIVNFSFKVFTNVSFNSYIESGLKLQEANL